MNDQDLKRFLTRYERLYAGFDKAHSPVHMEHVRDVAARLAAKYAPEKERLARIAAVLHDIGISKGREGHEIAGAEILKKDPEFANLFSPAERRDILHAVRQHRSTTGAPRTILAKIISDADRTPSPALHIMQRADEYRRTYHPQMTAEERLIDSAAHLSEKFAPGGPGRRTYFPETASALSDVFDPILEAHKKKDLEVLRKMLEKKAVVEYGVLGFEKLPEGYLQHLMNNLHVAVAKRSGTPGGLKHDIRRGMHALHGVIPHKLTSHESYGPLKKHAFVVGLLDELEKKAGEIGPVRNITNDDIADFGHLPFFRFHKSWSRKIVRAKNGDLVGHAAYEPDTGELKGLWVHPRYRRRGVATKLLKSLSKDVTFLTVLRSNKAAKSLYTGFGFKVTGPGKGNWGSRPRSERMEKKAEEDTLFHGSPKKLKILVPKNLHGDPDVANAVFATPSREFALPYAGRKWGDRDVNQSTQIKNGVRRVTLQEMRPGAFKDIFDGKKGYMYTVPKEPFKPPAHKKPSTWEVISEKPVEPIKVEEISDVGAELRRAGVKLFPYNYKDTIEVLRRRETRTSQMPLEKQRGYYKWWMEKAPPEIMSALEERMKKLGALVIAPSKIHGEGLFTTGEIPIGENIGLGMTQISSTGNPNADYAQTRIAKKVNHSSRPNVELVREGDELYLVTTKKVKAGEEITADYATASIDAALDFIRQKIR